MSNLIPIVTPANNALGIPVGFIPTSIFEKSMEIGSVSSGSCFLVEISSSDAGNIDQYLSQASISNILPAQVTSERINLLDENPYTGLDFGGDINSGEKYRTKISIDPSTTLKPNTTYAAILSKDLSLVSVFDPESSGTNTGTGSVSSKGPYKGLAVDTYTITIVSSGNKNSAKYVWSRSSDGHTSVSIGARGRFIEIDKGLELKFLDGDYQIGDSFSVKVIPEDKQAEIFSWIFSTGSGEYQTPADGNSGNLLNLPVIGQSGVSGDGFFIVDISPSNAESMLRIPRKASVTLGDISFITLDYVSTFNSYSLEFLGGGVAGSETVSIINGTEIQVIIEDGVSSAQQIVNAINAESTVNASFIASTKAPATAQSIQAKAGLSEGVDKTTITITFNKDLNASSIADKIKLTSSSIYPSSPSKELLFSTSVTGKQLIMTLLEQA